MVQQEWAIRMAVGLVTAPEIPLRQGRIRTGSLIHPDDWNKSELGITCM